MEEMLHLEGHLPAHIKQLLLVQGPGRSGKLEILVQKICEGPVYSGDLAAHVVCGTQLFGQNEHLPVLKTIPNLLDSQRHHRPVNGYPLGGTRG